MTASIIFDQVSKSAGVAGKARNDFDVGLLVTCSNATSATSYAWTLVDVPIRSALTRGTTSVGSEFTFTPDVKGTYKVALRVNGSPLISDNAYSFCAVLSYGAETLNWRYKAAAERDEDNITYAGLNFPSDVNPRGWATQDDLEREQVEAAVYKVENAAVATPGVGIASLVQLDTATGLLDPTVIPSTGGTPFGGDTGSGGTQGAVPAPGAGDAALYKYLSADGTWMIINQDQISPGFSIASFTKTAPNPGTLLYRRGDTLSAIAVAAAYVSGPPISANIVNILTGAAGVSDVDPGAWVGPTGPNFDSASHAGSVKRNGTDLGAEPKWTIELTATGTAVDVENIVITWTRDVYYGVGAAGLTSEAQIKSLPSNTLSTTRTRNITVSPSNQKVYYAYPKAYGTATFMLNGFPAAFNAPFELAITNVNGLTFTYYVYESTNLLTGTSLVFVVT